MLIAAPVISAWPRLGQTPPVTPHHSDTPTNTLDVAQLLRRTKITSHDNQAANNSAEHLPSLSHGSAVFWSSTSDHSVCRPRTTLGRCPDGRPTPAPTAVGPARHNVVPDRPRPNPTPGGPPSIHMPSLRSSFPSLLSLRAVLSSPYHPQYIQRRRSYRPPPTASARRQMTTAPCRSGEIIDTARISRVTPEPNRPRPPQTTG